MAAPAAPTIPRDPESCRDGRDLENGRDLEVQPLVQHFTYDVNSRWHRFKKAVFEPPKATVSIYADIPFNHAEWKRHRNAAWRHRPQLILFMRVAGGFWWQLTYVFIVSVLVGLYHEHVQTVVTASSRLSVPFNLTTFALSLLLVFRTNSSYSRWWEARQIWGAVVNLSRNYSRQSLLWLPPRQARVAVRWMMAAPYLLKCHLRFNASVRENVSHVLLPQELDWVLSWTHRPNAAAHVLATAVAQSNLDGMREMLLMGLVNTFIDCVGKCERIFKTPIPAAYTRHTSRYLMIYLTACPLVLWPSLGWWTVVAATLICFLLLGTENIGVQIEEPFRVLPLDDMCRGIEATLREMERQHNRFSDQQYLAWQSDPAGITRASSESSLDSFQDGPADGPSEPAALNRFHHIPPPAPLAAAAAAIRGSFRRPSGLMGAGSSSGGGALSPASGAMGGGPTGGGGGRVTSGELYSAHTVVRGSNSNSGGGAGGGLISGLWHHVLHPQGSGGAGESSEAADHGPGYGSDGTAAVYSPSVAGAAGGTTSVPVHYPHHVHHIHRRLPQHPADVPGGHLAGAGGSGTAGDSVRAGGAGGGGGGLVRGSGGSVSGGGAYFKRASLQHAPVSAPVMAAPRIAGKGTGGSGGGGGAGGGAVGGLVRRTSGGPRAADGTFEAPVESSSVASQSPFARASQQQQQQQQQPEPATQPGRSGSPSAGPWRGEGRAEEAVASEEDDTEAEEAPLLAQTAGAVTAVAAAVEGLGKGGQTVEPAAAAVEGVGKGGETVEPAAAAGTKAD